MMFRWSNHCWGLTLSKVMRKIQNDFVDFAMTFFLYFSYLSVFYTQYCLILLYLYDFELKQWKKIWKISVVFKIFRIDDFTHFML